MSVGKSHCHFNRRTIPLLRSELLRHAANDGHLRMLEYLLFTAWIDEDDPERLVVSQAVVWSAYPEAKGHKSARTLLRRFEADTGIELHMIDSSRDRAATVRPDFPRRILEAVEDHFDTPVGDRTVCLVTGKTIGQRKARKKNKEARELLLEAVSLAAEQLNDSRKDLLNLLNNQSHERIACRIKKAVSELERLAKRLPGDDLNPCSPRGYTRKVIDSLKEDPLLVYAHSDRTMRISAVGPNLTQLPRPFRLLALSLCGPSGAVIECDLHCCHFAVAAQRWNLTTAMELLLSDRNLWTEFLEYLGLDTSFKPIIKKTIYSIIYGMGKKLRGCFLNGIETGFVPVKGVGDARLWTKFRRHPIIKELFAARQEQIAIITTDQGGYDAFGNWVANFDKLGNLQPLSTLAAISQSYEQKLMYPMLDVLKSNKQMYVLAYLHDGLTIYCSDAEKQERQIAALRSAVRTCADELGILTELETEELNPNTIRAEIADLIELFAEQTYGQTPMAA